MEIYRCTIKFCPFPASEFNTSPDDLEKASAKPWCQLWTARQFIFFSDSINKSIR